MNVAMDAPPNAGKFRTAWVLASIALVFFLGVIIRHWLW
jgi:hypothetical protein